jgi:hypothetical protein
MAPLPRLLSNIYVYECITAPVILWSNPSIILQAHCLHIRWTFRSVEFILASGHVQHDCDWCYGCRMKQSEEIILQRFVTFFDHFRLYYFHTWHELTNFETSHAVFTLMLLKREFGSGSHDIMSRYAWFKKHFDWNLKGTYWKIRDTANKRDGCIRDMYTGAWACQWKQSDGHCTSH